MANGLAEIVLVVRDVATSASFYRDVVGLIPNTKPSDEWAWFWAGPPGVAQRLAVHKGPLLFEEHSPRPPSYRFGPIHFALHVPREELENAVERVRSAGVPVFGPTRLDWMNAISWYFYDPDANLVEFWSPDPPA